MESIPVPVLAFYAACNISSRFNSAEAVSTFQFYVVSPALARVRKLS
jgi:hypothetical protein